MIPSDMRFYEAAGNLHIHSVYSDGTGLHSEIAAAAAIAGLDFVIVTDHNVWVDGVEGYHDSVLLLVGEEVHDARLSPQSNHLLTYGAEAELVNYASEPQALIDEVNQRAGLCFLAHPFEKGSPISPDLAPIPWVNWAVNGYDGMEIWNTMSEFKGLLRGQLAALLYAHAPSLAIKGPFRATLRKWDQLLSEGRKVTAIGGADAHANTYHMGPLERVVFPYSELFRWVNTHLLLKRRLSGDVETDKGLIYDALRAGRTWVGYDRPASTQGFRFHARSGANMATLGDELVRAAAVTFEVELPARGYVRLINNGQTVARGRGRRLMFTTAEPGSYRVEVRRWFRGLRRGWIYSSPIYVR